LSFAGPDLEIWESRERIERGEEGVLKGSERRRWREGWGGEGEDGTEARRPWYIGLAHGEQGTKLALEGKQSGRIPGTPNGRVSPLKTVRFLDRAYVPGVEVA
jgi:hypothetical protein